MKTLIILRHGKAESYNEDGDRVRQLAERGFRDAKTMGHVIAAKVGIPDLVVSSDAVRARQTAVEAAREAGYKGRIQYQPDIYEANSRTLLRVVRSLPDTASTVLLVGHNPGLEDLGADLIAGELSIAGLPTAGMYVITIQGSWSEADVDDGSLLGSYSPKEIHQ
ncbi:MAG TPA: histidine phosphatase family protein [Capsulimonadaceae bacterium]